MQALMLAAGMGKRLGKYTSNQTKCMVSVCGMTLIERAILALRAANITKLIMVVGYRADTLVSFLNEHSHGMEIEYVYNHDYATTNNIYSLYLAREYLTQDDTILLESDLIYDPEMVQRIVSFPYDNVAAIAPYMHWMHGTVTKIDATGTITQFIPGSEFLYSEISEYYKTINIYKFSKEFSQSQYIPFLEAYIRAYGVNQYYELVLKVLSSISNAALKGCVFNDIPWYEIDDAQDLDIANVIFAEPSEKLKKLEHRFGGYWRLDNMKDFCYLVNPYFPPQEMMDQYRYFFDTLLSQYPSGMNVQRLLAAKMFNMNEEYLLVGNGAAELINTFGRFFKGRMGVVEPTFNEYIRCFSNCEIIRIRGSETDFRFSVPVLLDAVRTLDAIAIINPDNPSGAFLKKDELMQILDECNKYDTICIVDESFIDFAEKDLRYTLLSDDILERYPTIIVVKSISKSYGVPGIRLGVMATANVELLKTIRSEMAIWNINSFAEFFLQNFELYSAQYAKACNEIAFQRKRLIEHMSKLPSIKPYESQANYVMCELVGETTATILAEQLLSKYNILIKDLSGKAGFDNSNYIRVAVKTEAENDMLVRAMAEILH